jgi:hypothetical protein
MTHWTKARLGRTLVIKGHGWNWTRTSREGVARPRSDPLGQGTLRRTLAIKGQVSDGPGTDQGAANWALQLVIGLEEAMGQVEPA